MADSTPDPKARPDDPHTCSTSILCEFTDVPGGLPLDSPEVLERQRRRTDGRTQNQQETEHPPQSP
jgi:hypothetical protein